MKILLGGAFGHLGQDILKELINEGHDVVALGRKINNLEVSNGIKTVECDVTKPDTLKGVCKGVDCVISTIGLTTSDKNITHYDVDLNGNLNLLEEAKKNNVKKFIFISVIKSDSDSNIPMLDAKYKFEQSLIKSNIDYTIYRPTGYFYDIAKVFKPMIDKGCVKLLKDKKVHSNVIDTNDLADYIVRNISKRSMEIIDIGGKEVYSYEEIGEIFFECASKPTKIKYISPKVFDIFIFVSKITRNKNEANIKFGKWTLSNDMTASVKYGDRSFKEYIKSLY